MWRMSIVQARRHSDTFTPESDAPVPTPRYGSTHRSATYHPAALTAAQDEALGYELARLFEERLDDASEIAISVVGGRVSLQGSVSCDLIRILAEDLVFAIPEIRECHNDLVVRNAREGSSLAA
jgi:hypothetical protein